VLSITVFFAIGIETLLTLPAKVLPKVAGRILVAGLCFLLLGVHVFPLWTGKLYESEHFFASKQVTFPDYVRQTSAFLDSKKEQFAVLPLPPPYAVKLPFWWNGGRGGYAGNYPFIY